MKGKNLVSFRRNWGDKKKSLSIFGKDYNNEYYSLQLELAKGYYEELIRSIQKNTFGFKLAPSTLRLRRSKGINSELPFMETKDYINAIYVEGVSVKILDGTHKPSGLKYSELFNILEFGRKDLSIPARPVFRFTREKYAPIVEKKVNELTAKYLKKGIYEKNNLIKQRYGKRRK